MPSRGGVGTKVGMTGGMRDERLKIRKMPPFQRFHIREGYGCVAWQRLKYD